MVVVSCLRQKGTGPSEWNERVLLLPKQNDMGAMSDIYGAVSLVWDGGTKAGKRRGRQPCSGCYNRCQITVLEFCRADAVYVTLGVVLIEVDRPPSPSSDPGFGAVLLQAPDEWIPK